jgi:hypothetical protein
MNTIHDFFIIVNNLLDKQVGYIISIAEKYFFEYGYYAIVVYSKLQIFLTPYYEAVKYYVTKKYNDVFPFKEEPNNIEFIKNGQTIFSSLPISSSSSILCILPKDYDFIIYTDKTNKVLYKTFPDNFAYEVSKLKFFYVEFQYNDDTRIREISLKTDKFNYYVVNNIIDAPFIKYFLQRHYPQFYCELYQDYTLKILDNNVKKLTIGETQYLRILENSYSLDT